MTQEKLKELLDSGEGFTIEYKECVNGLNDSVFETVCSFSNRYGGHILLGVTEEEHDGRKTGRVIGVNPNSVQNIKKNFITVLNNPNKINPSLYLNLEEIQYEGMIVLWVYIPASSQVEFCGKEIYDRNGDADQVITKSIDLVFNLYSRKSGTYRERKLFPYVTEEHLCMDLLPVVRQMALNRDKNHPWKSMNDMELFRSSGLYEEDFVTGQKGFNLAAVLLFGKAEVIQSCAPGYRTDAIYRNQNMDRYDDRLIVESNLIKAYDLLMEFVAKHTDDRFFLIDNVNTSVRNIISREVISNILVHREFGSAFPAKLIIEKDRIYSENWNRSLRPGKIEPQTFTPYPKNPILAKFFMNIGRADTLGSGVRNLYKYTKIYSGGEPELKEGDVFQITIPLIAQSQGEFNKYHVTERQGLVLNMIRENPAIQIEDIMKKLDASRRTVLREIQEIKKQIPVSYDKKTRRWTISE